MRRLGSVFAALLISGVLASVGVAAPVAAAAKVPKVVLIVGPAGAATSGYRAEARAAAAVARSYTPDVTEIYSPNATWPAVKAALQGASLVVYMGHGNGWPSPYRNALNRPTQNGFGLNPTAGGNDSTHQYFGEKRIAASIDLAKQRRRAAPPPVLRERQLRAWHPGGDAGPGEAARRQLRGRVHRRGRIGGHRRGARQPVGLREGDPRRRPVDQLDLAHCPECQRARLRVRERAQPGLRRADGPEARRPPASSARSSCARDWRRPTCSPAPAARRAARLPRSCPVSRTCSRRGVRLGTPTIKGSTAAGGNRDPAHPVQDQGP